MATSLGNPHPHRHHHIEREGHHLSEMAELRDNRTSLSNMPTSPPVVPMATTTVLPTEVPSGPQCDQISVDYDIAPAVICAVCFVFGILYCFFGYRFFKATMFMTGFIFGGLVTYLICLEENLLPLEGKIGASVAAGVLCGLITMLVQYVGLFMTGFNLGLLLAVAALIVLEQFYHPPTKWIPIGAMFGTGLLSALLSLYFQRSLTILGTSLFGAALLAGSVDYYVEQHIMVLYVWDRIKAEPSSDVCWYSWLLLGVWPLAFIVGAVAQWRVTGKGFDHHEVVHTRRRKKVNLKRARQREERRQQQPCTEPGTRYRHLYQIRRVNGDVISQSFIHNIQHSLSPGLRILSEAQYQQTLSPPQVHAINPASSSHNAPQSRPPQRPPPPLPTYPESQTRLS